MSLSPKQKLWKPLHFWTEHYASTEVDPYEVHERFDRLHRWRKRLVRVVVLPICITVLVLAAAGFSFGWYLSSVAPELPSLQQVQQLEVGLSSVIYTADGRELTKLFQENRTWVPYDRISPYVIQALVAIEDHRFFEHGGIDYVRVAGAAYSTLRGERREGASTITMQLVRNIYPEEIGNAIRMDRKVKEALMAVKLENHFTKKEILELYLNTMPFGYNAFGIEAAAQTFFSRSSADLNVVESATLAAMLKSASRFNPIRYPDRVRERRNLVLSQMIKHGFLSWTDIEWVREQPLGIAFKAAPLSASLAPHFTSYVRSWLEAWGDSTGHDIYREGLRVYTTLDPEVQEMAQSAVDAQMEGLQAVVDYEWSREDPPLLAHQTSTYTYAKERGRFDPFAYFWKRESAYVNDQIVKTDRYRRMVDAGETSLNAKVRLRAVEAFMDSLRIESTRLEAGLTAIDPHTGYIKAWVGGRDFTRDQYDKVGLARRQPGSTFKPIVYATAIDQGFSPYEVVADTMRTYNLIQPGRTWTPRNSDGLYTGGIYTLKRGLALSKNTVTAQLMYDIGPEPVMETASLIGVRSKLSPVLSLGLGTSEVTLLEMVSAYTTFANKGMYREPLPVSRIEDRQGNVIARFTSPVTEAISQSTSYTIVDMLRDVIDRGTGMRIRTQFGVQGDVAGKTGTTQNNTDGWFIMMHPHLVTGAWVGFNDQRLKFRSNFWGQGGHNALYVVGDFVQRVFEDADTSLTNARFSAPPGYEIIPPRYDTVAVAERTFFFDTETSKWYDMNPPDSLYEGFNIAYDSSFVLRPLGVDPLIRQAADPESALRNALRNPRSLGGRAPRRINEPDTR